MAFEIRYYTMLILNKDDIEFVTEFPCLLGHPVYKCDLRISTTEKHKGIIDRNDTLKPGITEISSKFLIE